MMAEKAEKEDAVILSVKKVPPTSCRSLVTPMNKLMHRLSGMPPESRTFELPRKARLSFQAWKRCKPASQEGKEEGNGGKKHESLVRLSLISSIPTGQSSLTLKRAPIAETEEVNLPDAKKPKLIVTAARRLSALSARPIRGNHRLRSKGMTDIVSPSEQINERHYSIASDSKRSRSAQLGEVNCLSSVDGIFGEYSFGMRLEDSASVYRKNAALELPMQLSATEPLNPSDFPKSKEMLQRVGKTLFNKDPYLGIDYLIKQGILSPEPRIIAEFLNREGLSRQAIGEYFGKLADPLAIKVTEEFVKRLDLRYVELDVALRRLLEKVHPDGESQKIEFLLEVLKKCYIEQNQEKVKKEFHDPETIGVLAYSIMLLHTTFYNRSARKYGIYDRIAENEFRTLPDPIDRLRRVDRLFTGPMKPEKLIQRYRRFISWFTALEVNDFTARKPLISRPTSQIRCLFVFNDLLVITKPLGLNRVNAVDDLLAGGSHRSRSIDRLANRVGSPAPLTVRSPPNTNFIVETPSLQKWGSRNNDIRLHCYYSTEVPPNTLYLIRQTIPLIDIKVLNFECEYYKYGVQLCDEFSVLISFSLPSGQIRKNLISLLHEGIWETKEIINFTTNGSRPPPLFPGSNASNSSGSSLL
ncbi:IQ motif and SEC7 domain-containing protein 3 [Taenia crassiceps]|uniref:IQ motif and SEC7 domain-containing protein 3 n=1 Tax=Taenia crassiceps TaxID=6207 RepID=A0ABR4QFZ4_9CEST